jgi:hypothetical protein
MNDPMRELPPVPPYDYYMTLENGDDYGCWSSETMRSYARAAIAAASQQAEPVWVHVDHHGDARVTSHDLPVGDHNLFAAPPVQQEPEPYKTYSQQVAQRIGQWLKGYKKGLFIPTHVTLLEQARMMLESQADELKRLHKQIAAMPVQAPVEQK